MSTDEERQGLLVQDSSMFPNAHETSQAANNTTVQPESIWEQRDREAREAVEKRFKESDSLLMYMRDYTLAFSNIRSGRIPTLWQRLSGVFVCIFISNVLNVLIPRQTGIIMDCLSGVVNDSPWGALIWFIAFRLAASASGIDSIRQRLWNPLNNQIRSILTQVTYAHLMCLSADFHDSKSSSDSYLVFEGIKIVSSSIELILLQTIPTLLDLVVAIIYLSNLLGSYGGFIISVTAVIFFSSTSRLMAKCRQAIKESEAYFYGEHFLRSTGLAGWHTISAFNMINYERDRHNRAVTIRWQKQNTVDSMRVNSKTFQALILNCGLLASCVLAVFRIMNGSTTPGKFITLLIYWSQLTSCFQFFTTLGDVIGENIIEAEHLLKALTQKPTIQNEDGAEPINFHGGNVRFNNVCYSYNEKKQTLTGITLEIPAGQTVAFVGETGAGKSTMLKLINRFYDVSDGSISIDGQDVRHVDLGSLRDLFGIVPQNPVLFNDTIMNNVRYGRLEATDEEVARACEAACIHKKIMSFSDGYQTQVGERGMKLSGGEAQRVAIARAILKNPRIVLLDESTSAVDSDTEQQIQRSLQAMCKGRTTIIIAHRLSTIKHADLIVVFENGRIIEQGSHKQLMLLKGRYADLCTKQSCTVDDENGSESRND